MYLGTTEIVGGAKERVVGAPRDRIGIQRGLTPPAREVADRTVATQLGQDEREVGPLRRSKRGWSIISGKLTGRGRAPCRVACAAKSSSNPSIAR